jgi:putative DNA methylase
MTSSHYPKRLIEVDLPIKRISEHARREKSIRHGHISTLHIWWARRPLAACRAVICAALWPDPVDPHCPQEFRAAASRLINEFARKAATDKQLAEHCSHEAWTKWQKLSNSGGLDSTNEAHWNVLRFALLDFIGDFADWDSSTVAEYLEVGRGLSQAAHEALGGAPGTKPLVVDPFAGGGSIPLEALRVGADAFASDLNPVAVLLNKVVLEYIPKYGQRLADELRKWGDWIKSEAERELAEFYPKDPDGSTPIAYLWARTVVCEGPGCGAEIPLLRSLWLSQRGKHSIAFQLKSNSSTKKIEFEIISGAKDAEVGHGTSAGGSATCPVCGFTTPVESVRVQLTARRGGASDARLTAVVTNRPGQVGQFFRTPTARDQAIAEAAKVELERRRKAHNDGVGLIPNEPINHLRGFFNVVLYGITEWGDLFSPRQALTLATFARLIRELPMLDDEARNGIVEAVKTCLALVLDRVAVRCTANCIWDATTGCIMQVFNQGQSLPARWEFAEMSPCIDSGSGWATSIEYTLKVGEHERGISAEGHVECASATAHPLPDESAQAVITDPPYYAAIPYADLSDFFYAWLKRSLAGHHKDLLSSPLTEKRRELVSLAHRAAMYREKDNKWFESEMSVACGEARRICVPEGLGVFVFANKETEAWEAMLASLIAARWVVTASWPIDTESGNRLRAKESAALASSVHLVCRPREKRASSEVAKEVGDWRDVLAELPKRIHEWMPRLAIEGIVGADAIFACLGPALEIFSRYDYVEKASGQQVALKEYLEYVWGAVAREALNVIFEGIDVTGFEEDARLTAMWLWTLTASPDGNEAGSESNEFEEADLSKKPKLSGFVLQYDAARKIAQGLGAHLEQLTSVVEIRGDKARLLPVSERAHHLFGKDEGSAPTRRKGKSKQLSLLDILGESDGGGNVWGEKNTSKLGNTVLDRVHQSMILFAAGRGEALKRFLVTDGAGQDQRFWRLAQALAALYPKGTDERRWVEGVLARKKGLGF